jgi:3-deoxy-manno-octulosonate cytidylyltransferase (CMP-KDO synthetase)
MKILGVIPARFASTRFPGKPLVSIYGKPMIQRVYEQATKSKLLDKLIVATDNQSIFETVKAFGGEVMMTAMQHKNGTERCAEVLEKLTNEDFDIVINIQGDEPFFEPESIALLASCFINKQTDIATLIKKIETTDDLLNNSVVKVVKTLDNKALYFSRFSIPFNRTSKELSTLINETHFFKHIGIYAYRTAILKKIVCLEESTLEKTESLEQLRWLENGFQIYTNITHHDSNSVDTPEDLAALLSQFDASYYQ